MLPHHLCAEPVKNRIDGHLKRAQTLPSPEGIIITAAQEAVTGLYLDKHVVEALQT